MSLKNDISKDFMKIKLNQKENKLSSYFNKIKKGLFYLFNELLKDYKPSVTFECINIFFQYFQFMYFPLDEYVKLFFILIFSLMLNGKIKKSFPK